MLKIVSMELNGFKSFFNKTEINFDESINIIVGPNGCGKSNICDAFKWVLGEQKVKSLRTSKMEDVIFAGSDKYKPLGMAEVTIKMKNDGNLESGEFHQDEGIEIKRRIFRDGKSEYLINGKKCRLKDIHQLFEGTGLGFSPYAIIEQGEISSIVSMKPLEKRELIEEAARIISFKNKKRSALIKLELSEKNLDRIRDIIFEIERNLRHLKAQASKAKRYRKYMSLKRDYLKLFLKGEFSKILKGMNAIEENIYEIENILKEKENEKNLLLKEKNNLEEKMTSLNRKIYQLKEEKNRLENEINNFLLEEKYKKEKIESNKNRIVKRKEEIHQSKNKLEWLKKEFELKISKYDEKRKKLEEFNTIFSNCERDFKQLEEESKKNREEVEKLKLEHTKLDSEKLNLKNEIIVIDEKLKSIEREKNRLTSELQEFLGQEKKIEKEWEFLNKEKKIITEKLSTLTSEVEDIDFFLEEIEESSFKLKEKLNQKKGELEGIKHKIKTLIQLEENKEFYSKETKKILEELKNFHEISGILSDFLNPGKEYVEVIERFLYPLFDMVILKENFEKIVYHLKEGSQSVTILLPHKVKEKDEKNKKDILKNEKVLGQVKDFIKLENVLKPYSNGLLKEYLETYIVENIDEAFKLNKKYPEAQFLSVDGIFIGKKGVISINKDKKKGILSFRKEKRDLSLKKEKLISEIETLEKNLEEEEFKREDLLGKKENLENEISETKYYLKRIKEKISSSEDEIKRIKRRIDFFINEKEKTLTERDTLLKQKKLAEKKLQEIETKIIEINKIYEKKKSKLNEIEEKLEKERENFYSMKSSHSSLKDEIKLMEDVLKQFKSQIETSEREILKSKKEIETLNKEIELIELELSKKNSNYKNNNLKIKDIEKTLKEKLEEKFNLDEKIKEAGLKLERIENEIYEFRDKKNAQEIKLIELRSELKNKEVIGKTELNMSIEDFYTDIEFENDINKEEITPEKAFEKYEYYKEKINKMGSINQMAIEEYEKERERLEFNLNQKKDIEESIISTKEAIFEMEKKSLLEFKKTFKEVNKNFKKTFKELFGGGSCELKLIDEDNPLESGVEIIASPPGKKLQNIMLLSGGEKALTALALLIALFKYRPAPFCILDEVDAPLDDANISRFLEMVKTLTRSTQFIIMTHNRKTMEIGENIYGVTMEEPGISKILSVKLKKKKELVS